MSKTHQKNEGKGLAGHNLRNELAVAAWNRKAAGPMQDRRRERGGARNRQREFLQDNDD
jgi:hypothetical protein